MQKLELIIKLNNRSSCNNNENKCICDVLRATLT